MVKQRQSDGAAAMTFLPRRHDLPNALVSADAPLSADVMGRSVEALQYLWRVTTNTDDSAGTACAAQSGHTHDGRNDQVLAADSSTFTKWAFGFGAPYFFANESLNFVNHNAPRGGWISSATPVVVIQSMFHVPFDAAAGAPANAAFTINVLIEKGVLLSAPNAVTVSATIGGITRTATSAVAATGLEIVSVTGFAAGAIAAGGPQSISISLQTAVSGDYVRAWHASGVTA